LKSYETRWHGRNGSNMGKLNFGMETEVGAMRVYDLIWKKRQGQALTADEIRYLINGYVRGDIPDYQMSAWCMAVFFQGMSFEEATALTLAMVESGDTVDLSSIPGIKVDKHSTGGVGDKTSLVVLPLVAAAGVPVAKMSGRGLGHTGGTLDKLESIPGFSVAVSRERFLKQAAEIGIVLAGQTADLVPADKKLYALRDLTATIESIPLIAGSIVSKKLASGADAVVLDVKYGDGAFMKNLEDARSLARTMVEIGNRSGRHFRALLTSMEQPLGLAIGNSLEVMEAIETLQGKGPADLTELSLKLGGMMVVMAGLADGLEAGEARVRQVLSSGDALAKFAQLVEAQGGNPEVIQDFSLLPQAGVVRSVWAETEGWVERIDCRELGLIAMRLGAGRNRLEDRIHPEVGLRFFPKIGTYLHRGDMIAEIYARSEADAAAAEEQLRTCIHLAAQPVQPEPLIKEII